MNWEPVSEKRNEPVLLNSGSFDESLGFSAPFVSATNIDDYDEIVIHVTGNKNGTNYRTYSLNYLVTSLKNDLVNDTVYQILYGASWVNNQNLSTWCLMQMKYNSTSGGTIFLQVPQWFTGSDHFSGTIYFYGIKF